jgi:CRISPR-associated protein Csm1
MSVTLYVAGEFYGIQKYVLGITAAGGGQAKRLRARSFVVQALEDVVVSQICAGTPARTVMGGGGQFVLALEQSPGCEERLRALRLDLQQRLFAELGGELGFNLGWGSTVEAARHARGMERHRPWACLMIGPEGWLHKQMRLDSVSPPCDICRKRRASKQWTSDGPPEDVCDRCDRDRRIGTLIPRVLGVELTEQDAEERLLGRGVRFRRADDRGDQPPGRTFQRYVPVHPDKDKTLLTFEQIAAQSNGDELLGVLKADVDNCGKLIDEHVRAGSLDVLSQISKELDDFFSVSLQRTIAGDARWKAIYTVFSGGDDLLLVGPWDIMLDFAASVEAAFAVGPGRTYGLKLSAGVSFMPPRIPVRHGVKRAEDEMAKAKQGPKNRCATLRGVWEWEALRRILGGGRELVKWWGCDAARKGTLRRLYRIVLSAGPGAHLWAWELGRNFPRRDDHRAEHRLFREWGERVLANWGNQSMDETRASLLYALTATRTRSKDERRDQQTEVGNARRARR